MQFLYCADLEGGADPAALRGPFWEFVTESDRRRLLTAVFRTVHHLAMGREGRLAEFVARAQNARIAITGHPEAESLQSGLHRIAELESVWSTCYAALERVPRDGDDAEVAEELGSALAALFETDRQLAAARSRFLADIEDFPVLRGPLEAVAATIRRLQRVSDRMRMVEEPEKFPDQADLAKLRDSKRKMSELRRRADELVDQVLAHKEASDATLAEVVENFSPERLDPVDRAILRLAIHELRNGTVPAKVAINEAVDLAKRFGTSDSGRFVNGVLDRVARAGGGLE